MNAKLEARSLTKTFRVSSQEITILNDINVIFKQGSSYAITGPSGVGKSTLLHCIAGIDKPTSGHVYYNNSSVYDFTDKERHAWFSHSVGLVFQQPYLIAELTVLENVILKAMVGHDDLAAARTEAQELLDVVGLKDKLHAAPHSLSGGQQQRVALARALLNKPAFLLADELTGNLDYATGARIMDLIMRYRQDHGMGLIISSHDPHVIERMEIAFNLHNGKLLTHEKHI